MENIIEMLASDNYIVVNKTLIKAFGLNEAVLLGELCSEYKYWKREDKLEDDMFYSTIDNIEENTGLSAHEQRQAIKSLENAGVLITELRGIPAKKYFKIDISSVVKILTSCSADFSQQDVKKLHSNNNKNNNKENTITINSNSTDFQFGVKIDEPKKSKKPSMWDKCINLIEDFTNDVELKELLVQSLKLFLENSKESGTIFYTNHFKGRLNKLDELGVTVNLKRKIVQQTLDNGWNNFYELKTGNSRDVAKDIEHLTEGLNQRAKKGSGSSGEKF